MTPRQKPSSRSRLSLRRRGRARDGFLARHDRRIACNTARETESRRAWCGLNFFWADCGRRCRRMNACPAADPRACFEFHWGRLDKNDKAFRRDFMQAFARLHDPDEAMVEAIALALMRRRAESAAPGAAVQ